MYADIPASSTKKFAGEEGAALASLTKDGASKATLWLEEASWAGANSTQATAAIARRQQRWLPCAIS